MNRTVDVTPASGLEGPRFDSLPAWESLALLPDQHFRIRREQDGFGQRTLPGWPTTAERLTSCSHCKSSYGMQRGETVADFAQYLPQHEAVCYRLEHPAGNHAPTDATPTEP